MRRQKIIICDTDSAYVRALSTYFISALRDTEIATYSSVERFCVDDGNYDVALLGREFIEAMDGTTAMHDRFGQVFMLTGDINESNSTGEYGIVYKFQKMQLFMENVRQIRRDPQTALNHAGKQWTGIYSPMRHELQLVFALAYCKQKQEAAPEKSVLFLDLEENSLFSELTGRDHAKNVTDYLYLLESDGISEEELTDCLMYYEGFACLPPVKYFQELVAIGALRWEKFFDSIAKLAFDQVVVLFDGAFRGTEELFARLQDLLLLMRDGDFYRKYDRQIQYFIKENRSPVVIRETMLPLSGANLSDGTYQLEQLLEGNLSQYVKQAIMEETNA